MLLVSFLLSSFSPNLPLPSPIFSLTPLSPLSPLSLSPSPVYLLSQSSVSSLFISSGLPSLSLLCLLFSPCLPPLVSLTPLFPLSLAPSPAYPLSHSSVSSYLLLPPILYSLSPSPSSRLVFSLWGFPLAFALALAFSLFFSLPHSRASYLPRVDADDKVQRGIATEDKFKTPILHKGALPLVARKAFSNNFGLVCGASRDFGVAAVVLRYSRLALLVHKQEETDAHGCV